MAFYCVQYYNQHIRIICYYDIFNIIHDYHSFTQPMSSGRFTGTIQNCIVVQFYPPKQQLHSSFFTPNTIVPCVDELFSHFPPTADYALNNPITDGNYFFMITSALQWWRTITGQSSSCTQKPPPSPTKSHRYHRHQMRANRITRTDYTSAGTPSHKMVGTFHRTFDTRKATIACTPRDQAHTHTHAR